MALIVLLAGFTGVFLVFDVYIRFYHWLRALLGEVEPDPIPAARMQAGYRQGGFPSEPQWLRPLQAGMLATGLTLGLVSLVGIILVAVCSAIV